MFPIDLRAVEGAQDCMDWINDYMKIYCENMEEDILL